MKKIIPFNNVLDFNTDVKEITAISLEHEINKFPDMVSGVFYISGEYKITEGLLEREKFNFELPFDIALTNNYDTDSLLVDIDDFRYDLISDKNLKVNIDLYIDGEEILPPEPRNPHTEELIIKEDNKDIREITEDILSVIKNDNSKQEINNFDESNYQENINLQKELNNKKEEINNREELETNNLEKENISKKTTNEEKNLKDSKKILDKENIEIEYEKLENKINKEKIFKEYEEKEYKEHQENNNYDEVIDTKENEIIEPVRIDLLKDMLTNNKEDNMNEELNININNNNNQLNKDSNNETESEFTNNNLFSPEGEEKYVTYRVYTVLETDNIDTILNKYNITKDLLADYNNIENLSPGDKLIIPTYEK